MYSNTLPCIHALRTFTVYLAWRDFVHNHQYHQHFSIYFLQIFFNGKCWLLSKWNRHAVERTIDYLILTIPNLSENDKCADNIAARAANSDTATSSYRKLFYQPNRAKQVWTACMLIKQQPAKTERYAQSPQALGGRYGSEPQPGCGSR